MVFVTQNDMGGLGQALQQVGGALGKAFQQRGEATRLQQILNPTSPSITQEEQDQSFINKVQSYENETGNLLDPSELDFMWKASQQASQAAQQAQGTPKYSTQQLAAIAKKDPQLASVIQRNQIAQEQQDLQQQKILEKQRSEKESRNFQRNKPLFEKTEKVRNSEFKEELALTRLEDSLASGQITPFVDWAMGELGLEPGKTTEAQVLESAAKELFMGNLEGVTGIRFNQFLEKILRDAGPNLGKSPEANQEFLEAAYIAADVKAKYVEEFDKLEEQFDKKGLELPKNASKLIQDKIRPYEAAKIKEYNKIKKEIKEGKVLSNTGIKMRQARRSIQDNPPPEGSKWIMDPQGQIKAIPFGLLNEAKKSGGRVLDE